MSVVQTLQTVLWERQLIAYKLSQTSNFVTKDSSHIEKALPTPNLSINNFFVDIYSQQVLKVPTLQMSTFPGQDMILQAVVTSSSHVNL